MTSFLHGLRSVCRFIERYEQRVNDEIDVGEHMPKGWERCDSARIGPGHGRQRCVFATELRETIQRSPYAIRRPFDQPNPPVWRVHHQPPQQLSFAFQFAAFDGESRLLLFGQRLATA